MMLPTTLYFFCLFNIAGAVKEFKRPISRQGRDIEEQGSEPSPMREDTHQLQAKSPQEARRSGGAFIEVLQGSDQEEEGANFPRPPSLSFGSSNFAMNNFLLQKRLEQPAATNMQHDAHTHNTQQKGC
eukprot:TRINITY_DN111992_c0_g1_i1.p2 TRINITY_DN111992_c0_g1~~TRINITY_DN111992_c0_g1_i1.p2  ORF type:complete len:128 (+),score=21.68 TRINITY_DN111992_c0_g1_i1:78-461(+)